MENLNLFGWLNNNSKSICEKCGKEHPFLFLKGDLILLGGFYGTDLKHAESSKEDWISFQSPFSQNDKTSHHTSYQPSKMVEQVGMFDVCKTLVKNFKKRQVCSNNEFRFHSFGYDWRNDLKDSAVKFDLFVKNIYENNGNQPVSVVGHSMGGLVLLAAVNSSPHLYKVDFFFLRLIKNCVFAGSPFHSAPIILWALNRGFPSFINPIFFSSLSHLNYKSSFIFLPRTPGSIIDYQTGDVLDVELWKPETWKRFSPQYHLRGVSSSDPFLSHIRGALLSSSNFLQSIQHTYTKNYPRFAVVKSKLYPTVTSFYATHDEESINLVRPAKFEPGDGIVTSESANMPDGYTFKTVTTNLPHPNLLNDVSAIEKAFELCINE